jgi:5-methylcytosine-specific restriction protein B
LPQAERAQVFADYDRFMAWMGTVPPEGNRQFRHMLRYFLFPERVERMSSNGDRYRVLDGFGVAKPKVTRRWTDVQLDDAMLKLRRELEERYGSQDIDFYLPPLRSQWMSENESDESEPEPETDKLMVAEDAPPYRPAVGARNLILYGPPGTGKTWRLQKMFLTYTDQAADVDRATWEVQLVARYGWRAVIAAALAEMEGPVKVTDLLDHPLIKVKAIQRKRSGPVRATVWGYMQEHTPFTSATVNTAIRRPPFIFDKSETSEWFLTPDWQEADDEATELSAAWRTGPGGAGKAVQRYRVVTFHPSYSYEDFVIGLRPVVLEDAAEGGVSGFRMVDGVFKQICAEARSNPAKRYALFIDEINRANIAKVFGELITLIEPDKRARYDSKGNLVEGMEVQLPGTGVEEGEGERFGVPENLDIYGTMNTADRSIALLDIALRRRFEFEEIPPEYGVLDRRIDGVDLGRLLLAINDRLEFLADRDRRIGHAYFTRVASLDDLRTSFRRQVIPLLQEFFFDDWGRVALVLSARNGRSAFVRRELLDGGKLFGNASDLQQSERFRHEVTAEDGWTAEAFQSIYRDDVAPQPAAE